MSDDLRPMTEAESAAWGRDVAATLTGWNALALYLSIVLGVVGIFMSMIDADGEQLLVLLIFFAPGLYGGWLMIDIALRRDLEGGAITRRLAVASFFSGPAVAVVLGVIQAIIVAFPRMRAFIEQAMENNHGHHYWWQDGIVGQIFLVPLAAGFVALLAPLAVTIVVVPIIRGLRARR